MEIQQTHIGPAARQNSPVFHFMMGPHILTELRFVAGGTVVVHARNCPACLGGSPPTNMDIVMFAGKN